MATPEKAITYLTPLGTQAPNLPAPQALGVSGLLPLTRSLPAPLWRPVSFSLGAQAPEPPPPQPLEVAGWMARLLTIFWRGGSRRGWQIYPSGRNR